MKKGLRVLQIILSLQKREFSFLLVHKFWITFYLLAGLIYISLLGWEKIFNFFGFCIRSLKVLRLCISFDGRVSKKTGESFKKIGWNINFSSFHTFPPPWLSFGYPYFDCVFASTCTKLKWNMISVSALWKFEAPSEIFCFHLPHLQSLPKRMSYTLQYFLTLER